MKWRPAKVGCHWYGGDFTISTYICGTESGYAVYHKRQRILERKSLRTAQRAAEHIHKTFSQRR